MESMKFMIGGKEMELNHHEMKHIADVYWEHAGKHDMLDYSKHMIHKAETNIAEALGMSEMPKDEDSVKDAIAYATSMAFMTGDFDMFAEVVYESAERAAACFSYKSITEKD
jgi:hypothetical protein